MKMKPHFLLTILIALLLGLMVTPAFAGNMKAVPSEQKLMVNGRTVDNIPVYNINGSNYFKLRDIAYYLDFEVDYFEQSNVIAIMRGGQGDAAGISKGKAKTVVYGVPSSQKVFIDTKNCTDKLHPVNIQGNNYFQLRELAVYADYGVYFDKNANSIRVDANYKYSPDGLTIRKDSKWKRYLNNDLVAAKEIVQQKIIGLSTKRGEGRNGRFYIMEVDEYSGRHVFIPSTEIWTGQQEDRAYGYLVTNENDVEKNLARAMDNYPKTVVFFSYKELNLDPDKLCEPYIVTHGLSRDACCYDFNKYEGEEYYEYRLDLHYGAAGIVRMYKEGIISSLPNYMDVVWKPREADYSLLLNAVNQIESEYGVNRYSTDYEKVYAIYNYITENISYDHYMEDLQGTAYSNYVCTVPYPEMVNFALKNEKTICGGYAQLFQSLCYVFDVDCYYVSGNVTSSPEGHAWNIVKIDGQWYQVDSTWDAGKPAEGYRYFLLSDKHMGNTHIEDATQQYPVCPSDYPRQTNNKQPIEEQKPVIDEDEMNGINENTGNDSFNNNNSNNSGYNKGDRQPAYASEYQIVEDLGWGKLLTNGLIEVEFTIVEEYINYLNMALEWDKDQHILAGVKGIQVGNGEKVSGDNWEDMYYIPTLAVFENLDAQYHIERCNGYQDWGSFTHVVCTEKWRYR